jgi:hypothetical protein
MRVDGFVTALFAAVGSNAPAIMEDILDDTITPLPAAEEAARLASASAASNRDARPPTADGGDAVVVCLSEDMAAEFSKMEAMPLTMDSPGFPLLVDMLNRLLGVCVCVCASPSTAGTFQ